MELTFSSVTVLILLATAAGTGIISADLWTDFNGFLFYGHIAGRIVIIFFVGSIIITGRIDLFLVGRHLTHVCLLLTTFFQYRLSLTTLLLTTGIGWALRTFLHWKISMAKEGN